MEIRDDRKYTESHEWVKVEGNMAQIGITDYAQESLGDIVYVELPEQGAELSKGDEAVNIESVKVAEAVYAPVSGTVESINNTLEDAPEAINKSPFETFIYTLSLQNSEELKDLMDAKAYSSFVEGLD
ncbi:MAG: glycine cleavage system protein GcvH [Spirochaetales bacterium]|nr:glycine cleavage system protein GcvH [Spirochaetales bacterium]